MTVCLAVVAMAFVSISCTKNVTVTMKDGTMSLAAVPEAVAPPAAVPAQLHAAEMAQAGHIYHGDGVQRDLRCGLGSNRSGENVGMTSPGIDDNRIFAGFMGSAGHKANILGPYRYIGTAWVTGADGAGYVSVEFAS
jgi:uncharacterized protein YkwD